MSGRPPQISLIAAVADNGVIGRGNGLPWHIPSELAYFKKVTAGKPLIFGRKTFETFGGRPLPRRPNIVVTRDPQWSCPGVETAPSLEDALKIAGKHVAQNNTPEIFIGGGAEIYRQALPLAQRFYLTHIHLKPEGDTVFPPYDSSDWVEISHEFHTAGPAEDADYTLTVLERKLQQ